MRTLSLVSQWGLKMMILYMSFIPFLLMIPSFSMRLLHIIFVLYDVFLYFEVALELKINLAKFELVHVGDVSNVSGLACILGYRVSSLPMKYMGLSLDASFKAKFISDTIIKKMEKRFSWVEKTLLI